MKKPLANQTLALRTFSKQQSSAKNYIYVISGDLCWCIPIISLLSDFQCPSPLETLTLEYQNHQYWIPIHMEFTTDHVTSNEHSAYVEYWKLELKNNFS